MEKGEDVAKAKRGRRARGMPVAAVEKPVQSQRVIKKTARIRAARNPITPLEVMLGAMCELWQRATALKDQPDCEDERLALIRQASAEAHKAAVYVHPRLASIGSGDEDEGGGRAPAKASDAPTGGTMPRLGSRDLARRLLFAIAVAEHFSTDRDPTEKP
jgi:hypothetical protein